MGTKINLIKSSFYFSSAFLEPTSWPDLEMHSTVALFNFINNFLLNILTRALVKKNPDQSIKKWLFEKEITTISMYLEECTFLKTPFHFSVQMPENYFNSFRTFIYLFCDSETSFVSYLTEWETIVLLFFFPINNIKEACSFLINKFMKA